MFNQLKLFPEALNAELKSKIRQVEEKVLPPLPNSNSKATISKAATFRPKTTSVNEDEIEQQLPEVVKKSIKTREQDLSVLSFANKVKYTDYYNLADFKVNSRILILEKLNDLKTVL